MNFVRYAMIRRAPIIEVDDASAQKRNLAAEAIPGAVRSLPTGVSFKNVRLPLRALGNEIPISLESLESDS